MTPRPFLSRHVRPGVRWFAIVAVGLLTPVVAFQVWDTVAVRGLAREVRLAAERGESLDEERQPGVWPNATADLDTAGPYVLAAAMLALGSEAGDAVAPVRDWSAAPQAEHIEAAFAKAHAVVERSRDALALVATAVGKPYRGVPAGTESNYRSAGFSALTLLLRAQMASASARGEDEEALDAALALLWFRGAMRDIGAFWRGDVDVTPLLTLAPVSDAQLLRLQAAVIAAEDPAAPRVSFLRARARTFGQLRRQHRVDPVTGESRQVGLAAALIRPLVATRLTRSLERWRALAPLFDRPWPEQRSGIGDGPESGSAFLGSSDWADASFRFAVHDPTLARDRAATAAIAVRRYQLAHAGATPDRLSDLVPQYLTAVPRDPFGGGELRYRRDPDAFTVYSVGLDGKDDGGDLVVRGRGAPSSRGLGPDVGFRVVDGMVRAPRDPRATVSAQGARRGSGA